MSNEQIVDRDYRNRRGPAEHITNSNSVAHYRGFRPNRDNRPVRPTKGTTPQNDETYRHQRRDRTAHTQEPEAPSPMRRLDMDYDSDDNLIVEKGHEYIGRRKKLTYAKETPRQFRARMEANEVKAKNLRTKNGGPAADARFEAEWCKTHKMRTDIPVPEPRSHSRHRQHDAQTDFSGGPYHKHAQHPKTALYDVLGCNPSSSPEKITNKYYQKAYKYHPDMIKNPSDEDMAAWDMVRRAGVVLRDEDNRKRYDIYGDNDTKWLNMQQCLNRYFV